MSTVVYDMSTSLDGFVAAAGITAREPLGTGGERLHEWAFGGDEISRKLLDDGVAGLGAMVTGRRTYELSLPWWGADGPTGPARLPLFVVTHTPPAEPPEHGVYRFVTDGVASAVRQAAAAANGATVGVSGAGVGRQLLRAGLVDEIVVHVVPVLFGRGDPFYDDVDGHVELEVVEVVSAPTATHIRYRVARPGIERRAPSLE